MKQLLSLFLFLLPCLAWAQYPSNGNQKITLGEQTTADGLIWRGVLADTGIITPSSDTSAYIILDTVNHRFYNYNRATNVWSVAGGTSALVSGTSGQVAYFDGTTSVTGDVGLIYSAANKTLGINTTTTSGANLIIKNSTEPARSTFLAQQTFGADTTNWTNGTGWTFNGTLAVATAATGNLTYTPSLTITSGNAYEITYTVTGYSAGTLTATIGDASLNLPLHSATANVILLLPTSATGGFRFTTSSFTGNLDNVSVVEITGSASVIFAGQQNNSTVLYNSIRMPNSSTIAIGGGGLRTTGGNNNFFGTNAGLRNTYGTSNNFFGINAGLFNTASGNNNFFGTNAGLRNTIGSNNNFFGFNAGLNNTTAANNNFFSLGAGQNNRNGSNNNFFGASAGVNNISGSNNNFYGTSAGGNNTTGTDNVAIGISSMNNTSVGDTLTGSNNIAIGTNAADNIRFAATGNVAIGDFIDLPDAGGSNQVVIKNIIFATGASGTGTTIAGSVGIGTNTPQAGYRMTVNDSLYVGGRVSSAGYTTRSDYNLKDEIKGINYGLNDVLQLEPVSYTYKSNGEHQLGFIAQDIGVIIPESVHFDRYIGVDYQSIIPILTKAIQEQNALIKALEQRIINLENK